MPKPPKTAAAREAEVQHLTSQLRDVGLPDEVTAPIIDDMRDFATTGQGFSKTVRVPGSRIAIVCLLSTQAHIASHIRITQAR
jgi:aspartate/methionine/tyrosine aminotransferase